MLMLSLVFTRATVSQTSLTPLVNVGSGAYSKHFVNPLSVLNNPASLVNIKSVAVAFYTERRFMQDELQSLDAVLTFPVQFGGLSISAHRFGYEEFNQTAGGITYAKSLGKIDLGATFNYSFLSVHGYGTAGLPSGDIGIILHLGDKLNAGMQLVNLFRSRFGRNHREQLPARYSSGIGYEVSGNLFLCAELVKEEDKPVTATATLQYIHARKFHGRFGLNTTNAGIEFGVGWKLKWFRVDVTGSYDLRLGLTPGLLVIFEGKKTSS